MTTQEASNLVFMRWDELRNRGLSCRERLQDLELQRLESDLEAIRREMEPIKQAIERRR